MSRIGDRLHQYGVTRKEKQLQALIIHDIELLPETTSEQFEKFVTTRDYVECANFDCIRSFVVVRADESGRAYRELIQVTDMDAFITATKTERFAELEKDFSALARITGEETTYSTVGTGYVAGGVE